MMVSGVIPQENNKNVRRKGEVRLHILPALTIVLLLCALVMSLTWLRDQTNVSLVARPYTAADVSDESAMTSTILTTLRGWTARFSNSAQLVIESAPVQTARQTLFSVVKDFRDLVTIDEGVTVPSQNSLWIRYLPLEDAEKLLGSSK